MEISTRTGRASFMRSDKLPIMASTAVSAGCACRRSVEICRDAHTSRKESSRTPNDQAGSAQFARRLAQSAAWAKETTAESRMAARIAPE